MISDNLIPLPQNHIQSENEEVFSTELVLVLGHITNLYTKLPPKLKYKGVCLAKSVVLNSSLPL